MTVLLSEDRYNDVVILCGTQEQCIRERDTAEHADRSDESDGFCAVSLDGSTKLSTDREKRSASRRTQRLVGRRVAFLSVCPFLFHLLTITLISPLLQANGVQCSGDAPASREPAPDNLAQCGRCAARGHSALSFL